MVSIFGFEGETLVLIVLVPGHCLHINLYLIFQGFSLTNERLLRTSLQCVVYKGEAPDARPQLEDCIIGPRDKWLHKRVI